MTKKEFLDELSQLLYDISDEEKEEAIGFYENYFEDAGEENEEEVLKELVSPQKVARSIKQLNNTSGREEAEKGYFTEKGYEDGSGDKYKQEVIVPEIKDYTKSNQDNSNQVNDYQDKAHQENTYHNNNFNQSSNNEKYRETSKTKPNIFLIILLVIIILPVGVPLFITAVSLMFAAVITVLSIWLTFGIVSVAFVVSGVVILAVSIIQLFTIPALGFLLAGVGLLLFGLGLLFLIATVWVTKTVLPFLFKGMLNLITLPFKNRRVLA